MIRPGIVAFGLMVTTLVVSSCTPRSAIKPAQPGADRVVLQYRATPALADAADRAAGYWNGPGQTHLPRPVCLRRTRGEADLIVQRGDCPGKQKGCAPVTNSPAHARALHPLRLRLERANNPGARVYRIAHEMGHTLGLRHDGPPIMDAGFGHWWVRQYSHALKQRTCPSLSPAESRVNEFDFLNGASIIQMVMTWTPRTQF